MSSDRTGLHGLLDNNPLNLFGIIGYLQKQSGIWFHITQGPG
jgi:hypothetical protein